MTASRRLSARPPAGRRRWPSGASFLLVALIAIAGCTPTGGGQGAEPNSTSPQRTVTSTTLVPGTSSTGATSSTVESPIRVSSRIVAAGDISRCDSEDDEQVADLLEALLSHGDGMLLALGDLAYPDGSAADFACYDDSWGRFKARTRPVVGNHEYLTTGASGYFGYFGDAAGNPSWGYYSLDIDENWHIVVLNSNCSEIGAGDADNGCAEGSPQERWLRLDLAAATGMNVLVAAHHPRWTRNEYDDRNVLDSLYEVAFEAGADIWLAGHEHHYERYRPLDPEGEPDERCGIREFIVGTGGGTLRDEVQSPSPYSEVRRFGEHGVLELELSADSYSWSFRTTPDGTVTDAGMAPVSGAPSAGPTSSTDRPSACGRR